MTKYLYLVESIDLLSTKADDRLNELGENGWKLIIIDQTGYFVFLKPADSPEDSGDCFMLARNEKVLL